MGPLRGDGNAFNSLWNKCHKAVEKMGPLRGDGNPFISCRPSQSASREDGSPSWGRKRIYPDVELLFQVEKMGPLRGDGNNSLIPYCFGSFCREDGSPSWGRKPCRRIISHVSSDVEKMGPLRGDGNGFPSFIKNTPIQ